MFEGLESFAIAIDGPVGVGKSTVARLVAATLGITYIDTGAMYRAVAYYNLQNGTDLTNPIAVANSMQDINIVLQQEEGIQQVYLNNRNITNLIRTQEISDIASRVVGVNAEIRSKLVKMQQKLAKDSFVVMDGRDIGSTVLPSAELKIYLDAAPEIRAKRRVGDLKNRGLGGEFAQILQDTIERDYRDSTRPVNPLQKTHDAILIDTGNLSSQEVADKIVLLANSR